MKRVYVSYRRDDTSESYVPIVSRLTEYFGAEAVLRTDTSYAMRSQGEESVSPQDYRIFVAEQLKQCAALLLIIGPHWLTSPTPGSWDIASSADPARIEVEEALRAGIPVVPALVQQATMPQAEELPPSVSLMLQQDLRHDSKHGAESLLALVSRTGMMVRRDPDFGGDAQRLCEVIENLAGLDAANPERAASLAGRTLRVAILLGGGALLAHAAILAYLANQFAMPIIPALAIQVGWQSKVVMTSLIDWGIFFLLGYFTGRRTGDPSLGIVASVASYLIGFVGGAIIFGDLTWASLAYLTPPASEALPALIVGAPNWIVLPVTYLMRPFILTFVALVLGAPLGLAASVGLGMLGGNWGANMRDRQVEHVARRERRSMLRVAPDPAESGSRRDPRAMIFRRRATQAPRYDEAALVGKVFISYRRDDSAVMCGAIYERLTQAFGAQAVFKDVDMIPVGVNFAQFINTSLEECVAQVVVIGPRWVNISTADGQRRLDDPRDFVRLEVESALRSGLVVIPALVQGARLPSADELPESLRPLVELTPSEVGYAPKFEEDIRQLTLRLAPTMFSNKKTSLLKRLTSVRVGLAATTVAATWWLALFTALGVTLGLAAYQIFLFSYRAPPTFIINYLASSPAIAIGFALIGGAHLAYTTGRMRRALWLIMRAALASVEAFALTSQIYGLIVYRSDLISASQNLFFKTMTLGAPLAGLAMLLGPLLFAALLSTAFGVFLRWLVRERGRIRRTPERVAMLYRSEDSATAARVSSSLTAFFGGRIVTPRWAKALSAAGGWVAGMPVWARMRRFIDETRWLRPVAFAFPRRAPLTEAEKIAQSLRGAATALALVGPGWITSEVEEEETGELRDPLLLSIETALGMNIPVIPTLLTGAMMPVTDHLPPSVREFSLLNAAYVRNPPDYDGDLRRLTRVIEEKTGLRQAKRLIDTALPVTVGAMLSALALAGVDLLAALLVARGLAHTTAQTTASQALIAGGVVLAGLIIYGMTAALVMRATNYRGLSVLTALLGGALGATAGVFALRYQAATVQTMVAQVAGSSHVYDQLLSLAQLFLVVRLLIALVGAVVVGFMGALIGRLAYQSRERRLQERRLLAMVRQSARSEPLAEPSARGVGVRKTQPIAPMASAAPTPAAVAPAADGATVAGAGERENLLRDMALAKERARVRARNRLLMLASGVVAIAVIVLVTGGALFNAQNANLITNLLANSTANAQAAATQTETEFAKPEAYSDIMPGGLCPGATGAAEWAPDSYQSALVTCETDVDVSSVLVTAKNRNPYLLRLTTAHQIANAYQLWVDTSFTDYGTCVGLVFFSDVKASSRMLFEFCDNGQWHLMSQIGSGSLKILAHGVVEPPNSNRLEVDVAATHVLLKLNGATLKSLTIRHAEAAPGDYLGIFIRNGGSTPISRISAEFNNFNYNPVVV